MLAMNAADALLLPSYHEGSPNAVKEAMAVGLPVVAAPVGDCAERLRGCWPGAVVQRDPAEFADATEAVLTADSRSNGRECIAPLELSAVARRVLDVYERVLGSQHDAAEVETRRSTRMMCGICGWFGRDGVAVEREVIQLPYGWLNAEWPEGENAPSDPAQGGLKA